MLNIKKLVILTIIIIVHLEYPSISYGVACLNCTKDTSLYIIPKKYYHKKTQLMSYKDQKTHPVVDDLYHVIDKIVAYPHLKQHSPSPAYNTLQVHLKNDAINIFHMFCNYQKNKKYCQTLPFIQLGLQNIFSEKIISLGGGSRYVHHDLCAIGYNTFYHFPISRSNYQSCLMNIGGEYWYRNTLFMINNFININNFLNLQKPMSYQKNIKYPNYGNQIHIQTKLPIFSEFTGKATLERLFYISSANANKKNYLDKKNDICKNYRLILGLDYYPIPILGFNISKIYNHNKNNNITYKILVNYKFNVSIAQQINNIEDDQNFVSPALKYFNSIVEPFIPPIIISDNSDIQESNLNLYNGDKNYQKNPVFQSFYNEIIGYPGEIKIIEVNNDALNEPIKWDEQTIKKLQILGGNIMYLKENIYIISMPPYTIQKDPLILSYFTANKKNRYQYKNQKHQILISVKNFEEKNETHVQMSHTNSQNKDSIKTNDDVFHENIDIVTNNHEASTSTSTFNKKNYHYQHEQYDISSNTEVFRDHDFNHSLSNHDFQNMQKTSFSLHDPLFVTTQSNNNDFLPLPPPPIILSSIEDMKYLSKSNKSIETMQEDLPSSSIVESSFFLPVPPPLPLSSINSENISGDNNESLIGGTRKKLLSTSSAATLTPERTQSTLDYYCSSTEDTLPVLSNTKQDNRKIPSLHDDNIIKNSEPNQNLLYLLSIQKKSKFSSMGTSEHINKLENTVIQHQKQKYLSDMEKIFSRLHLTQSSSSIDDYRTDNSNDSLFSSKSLDFNNQE